jgi:hypothetical protein
LAKFYPASYLKEETRNPVATSQIEIFPEGQKLFDDILLSALIVERLRLIPSESKNAFNYRAALPSSSDYQY